jgi:hypothetical protein
MRVRSTVPSIVASIVACASASSAAGVPAQPHPRLFMSSANVTGFAKNAGTKGTAAAKLVARCDETLSSPQSYNTRGGSDGDQWPGAAVSCAFAWRATQKATYLTQALKYWQASLEDDQTLGDERGCIAGVSTDWKSWNGNPPAPAVIVTITHDTGYPIRWYGPDVALTYDWLSGAPGVPDALLAQTRTCLTAWVDYYGARGYHRDAAGTNYNAGYVIAKTLAAVALGADGGGDGHLWTETTGTLFPQMLIGKGLAGSTGALGTPVGPMVGGDWAEGWQYGPLSVLEYAISTRALEENGVALPDMDAWASSLAIRLVHGTVPTLEGQFTCGDYDSQRPYVPLNANLLDAILAGPSNDKAASWAAFYRQQQSVRAGDYFYDALAELRAVTPADPRAETPTPSRWYLARGTRAMYVRTAWDANAFWGVFSSPGAIVEDHLHFAASNFVFTRGADHLIVDPSEYGQSGTLETNAVAVDSIVASQPDYPPSQTPWSKAELTWARGTTDAVYAARSDFAHAYDFSGKASDVPYAHREWVMLPEGEIVTIDRAHTPGAAQRMYVNFHVGTGGGGKLALNGGVATGIVGTSKVAIHGVRLGGATPTITQPETPRCTLNCSFPCGKCDGARFPVDEYSLEVQGPWAVAIHVIDGLAAGDAPALVGAIDDDTFDPAPKRNGGVIGAAVHRSDKRSYVVASSAQDGVSPATMTYAVPGNAAARHVVFDAPEDANGKSKVTASVEAGRCVITIVAGDGFAGRPLLFGTATAASGCTPTEDTNVGPSEPPPTPDAGPNGPPKSSGCGCRTNATGAYALAGVLAFGALGAAALLRIRTRSR